MHCFVGCDVSALHGKQRENYLAGTMLRVLMVAAKALILLKKSYLRGKRITVVDYSQPWRTCFSGCGNRQPNCTRVSAALLRDMYAIAHTTAAVLPEYAWLHPKESRALLPNRLVVPWQIV